MSLKSTRPAENSSEETWSSYMLDLYATRTKPVLGTYYIDKLEELAREKLKDDIRTYFSARCVRAAASERHQTYHAHCRRCVPLRLRERRCLPDRCGQPRRAGHVQAHPAHAPGLHRAQPRCKPAAAPSRTRCTLTTRPGTQVTIFGKKYRSPLFVAPVGVQGLMHADGELASARAASNVGVPFILSTAASRTIEAVAEANGSGDRWYQLYW